LANATAATVVVVVVVVVVSYGRRSFISASVHERRARGDPEGDPPLFGCFIAVIIKRCRLMRPIRLCHPLERCQGRAIRRAYTQERSGGNTDLLPINRGANLQRMRLGST